MRVTVLRRFLQFDVTCLHGDATVRAQGLESILDNLHERLLHLGFIKLCRVELPVQLQCPGHWLSPGILLKGFYGALQEHIEIAGSLRAGLLFLAAERAQIIRNFSRLRGRFLHFDQRVTPRVVRFHFAQDEGSMAKNTRQGVVEVQRHGPRQL